MKKLLHNISQFGLAVLLTAAPVLFALPANAQVSPGDSFNVTNTVNNAVAIINSPTNAPGTNGVSLNTGQAVSVDNYAEVGILLTGQIAGASNGTVNVSLVRSAKAGPPNSAADWETSSSMLLSASTDSGGRLYWVTNLPSYWVRPARWIGVSIITNTSPGTSSFTNFSASVPKKILPTRWP